MNRIKIYGGLGNQMFQYALCIALNEKGNKTQIFFSNFFYEKHHNGFNLTQAFNLKLPFPLNIYNYLLSQGNFFYKNKLLNKVLRKVLLKYNNKHIIYQEKNEFVYDKRVFQQQSSLLAGTWQVEEYFKDIEDIIKQKLEFKKPKDKKNILLAEQIKLRNSVGIHIRRGDYLTAKWSKSHKLIDEKTYYTKAINYLNLKLEDPQYFIFSDDIQWVKENLKFPNGIFVNHNKGKYAYIDMYLMSLCKHNIIANSTFSWWAAWLNPNKNKIVIAPNRWLKSQENVEICPPSWIKLEVNN